MDKPYLIDLPVISGKSATLSFLDDSTGLPISIERLYWIYGTDADTTRGNHAHLNSDRVLVCLQGEAIVEFENRGGEVYNFLLDSPAKALYFPRMHWVNIRFSANAIFLVASSCSYKEEVVTNDYQHFKTS